MGRYRVVIADDCEDIVELVSRLLPADLQLVAAVWDGQELIRCAERLQPDLIITDICMPVVSGIAAARQLIEKNCGAKFVFLTAHGHSELLSACRALGTTSYVVKSRVATDLALAIRATLAGGSFVSPGVT